MLTDQQVIELVQRIDPVSNVEHLPEPRHDAVTLLAKTDAHVPPRPEECGELLIVERSRSMDTQQRPAHQDTARRTGWRTAAVAFAAIILVVGAVAGFGAWIADDDTDVAGDMDVVAPTTEVPATTVPALETATPKASELRLRFHGEGCTYEGPTELQPGPAELIYVNESDGWSAMNFTVLDEGYTAQDVIDQLGPQPSKRHAPPWTKDMGTWEAIAAGGTLSWSFDLEAGVYVMVCARQVPRQGWEGWFGAGLTVGG